MGAPVMENADFESGPGKTKATVAVAFVVPCPPAGGDLFPVYRIGWG
jgi:hypothetical protein